MKHVFQIIDKNGNRLSSRQTLLRKNNLKLKKDSNNKKTYWKLVDGYLKNMHFHKYLDKQLVLANKKIDKWEIDGGAIKIGNLYLSHSLELSPKPYYWNIKYVDHQESKCVAYIGYGLGVLIIIGLIIYMFYCKECSPLLLLYIYLILIIYLCLYIQIL